MKNNNGLKKFAGLVWWSTVRNKYILPVFSIIQILLSFAIIYGLALMMPDIDKDKTSSLYLSSGSVTLILIAVGCVLSAQMLSTSKQDGIIDYQKTLAVSRVSIILADLLIWGLAALPGIIAACLAAVIRFDVKIHISWLSILVVLVTLATMIIIGFAIAYCFSAETASLFTQVIMIVGLLFSPITYSSDRLPNWLVDVYDWFPFVPTSNLIRSTLFDYGTFSMFNLSVILGWLVIMFALSLTALNKRD